MHKVDAICTIPSAKISLFRIKNAHEQAIDLFVHSKGARRDERTRFGLRIVVEEIAKRIIRFAGCLRRAFRARNVARHSSTASATRAISYLISAVTI